RNRQQGTVLLAGGRLVNSCKITHAESRLESILVPISENTNRPQDVQKRIGSLSTDGYSTGQMYRCMRLSASSFVSRFRMNLVRKELTQPSPMPLTCASIQIALKTESCPHRASSFVMITNSGHKVWTAGRFP